MSKVSYAATLSTGERLTRKSLREYHAAWAVLQAGKVLDSGFALTAQLAASAANASRNAMTGRRNFNAATSRKAKTIGQMQWHRELEREQGGRAAWESKIAAKEAELAVEVVRAKIVPEGF